MKKKLFIGAFMLLGVIFGAVALTVNTATETSTEVSASSSSRKFVKTGYRCRNCSCSGYWGYYHANGTYEGACQHTDKWGHRCGHSPEQHGLRSW